MNATTQFQSLKTPDLASGVALATELARNVSHRMAGARQDLPKPGGMNYSEPAPIPNELIASILLVAVSIANNGWSK